MKQSFWKWFGIVLIGLPIGCYTAFVAECYWNWFAVPILHVSSVSFLQMLGILWLIQVLTSRSSTPEDKHWALLMSVIELCVPSDKQKELAELKESNPFIGFLEAFSMTFGQIASNTLMLALGFTLHLFT